MVSLATTNVLRAGLLVFSMIFVFGLINRPVDTDDAWIGEHAYWLVKNGYVKSELMHGITRQEERVICHHKLLTFNGALMIWLFGFSLYALKSVALIYLGVFLIMFYKYTRSIQFSENESLLGVLLILSNFMVFKYAFIYRPEIPMMTTGFISFMILMKITGFSPKNLSETRPEELDSFRLNLLYPLLAGFAAGLCFLFHLNGVVFSIAGFLLLVWNGKFKSSIFFALGAIAVSAIYRYDFTDEYGFTFWKYQVLESPFLNNKNQIPGIAQILSLLREHERYFRKPHIIGLFLLFAGSMLLSYKKLNPIKNLITYTFFLFIFLGLLMDRKSPVYYILPFLPFMVLIIIRCTGCIFASVHYSVNVSPIVQFGKKAQTMIILLIAYFALNGITSLYCATEKEFVIYDDENVRRYISEPRSNLIVMAPMEYVFNEIDSVRRLQADFCYSMLYEKDPGFKGFNVLCRAKEDSLDYLFLKNEFIEKFTFDSFSYQDFDQAGFRLVHKTDDLMVLKNEK